MPGQILCKSLSGKTFHKNRTGGVAQGKGPEFKLQGLQKKKKIERSQTLYDSNMALDKT
jgi:hypothetical protein